MQYFYLRFVVLSTLLFMAGCGSRHAQSDKNILRMMTYNIHHAEGLDGEVDVERIAALIKESRADIVALQEVDRWTERVNKVDIMTALVDLTDMTYAFGKTVELQGGESGNGVLTRFPILEERNELLTQVGKGEQRTALYLVLDVRGQEVLLINTHLDNEDDDDERNTRANTLREIQKQYSPRPAILCGVLNDIPTSQTLNVLKADFIDSWEISGSGEGFTYPASQPVKRIDYILISKPASGKGMALRPVSARVIQSDASDHLPVLVEFEIVIQ